MEDETLLAAYIGPNWATHYRASFQRAAERRSYAFNWSAALWPLWMAYRGYWGLQLGLGLLMMVLAALTGAATGPGGSLWVSIAVPYMLIGALEGASGDRQIHTRAARAIKQVRGRGLEGEAALAALRRAGGVSLKGPVLLGAPTLLLGWLLYGGGPHDIDKVYEQALKSDLRNLVVAEEEQFVATGTYTATPQDSTVMHGHTFKPSAEVTVTMGPVTATGWSATSSSPVTRRVCGIFMGTAAAPIGGSDAREGEPSCDNSGHQ